MTLTKNPVKRPQAAHRKRAGQHHRRGEHYLKAYWPYIPVFAVLLVGVLLNSSLSRSHHSVLGYATDVNVQTLLSDTNAARSEDGQQTLTENIALTQAAQAKANDMARRNYWSHMTPDGQQPWSFITANGYNYQTAGENLAYGFGDSAQTIDAWMHSPEHRANMLNSTYRDVGFATADIPNYQGTGPETVIVALYASPANGSTIPTEVTPPTVALDNAQTVSRLQLINSSSWVALLVASLCGAGLMLFFVRHALAWHKVLVRGERFAIHHPFFDIFLLSATVLGFLLSHAAGSIL